MQRLVVILLLLAGVAAAVWGTVLMLRPQMDERLYAHYRKFPEITLPDSMKNTPVATAADFFNRKNYTRTVAVLDTLEIQNLSPQSLWLAAMAHLELEHYSESARYFALLRAQPMVSADELNWYSALFFLRKHERLSCQKLLETIPAGSAYSPAAAQLLKKIE